VRTALHSPLSVCVALLLKDGIWLLFYFICSICLVTKRCGLWAEWAGFTLGCPVSQDQMRHTQSFPPAHPSFWNLQVFSHGVGKLCCVMQCSTVQASVSTTFLVSTFCSLAVHVITCKCTFPFPEHSASFPNSVLNRKNFHSHLCLSPISHHMELCT
jgi:hypothetical protein